MNFTPREISLQRRQLESLNFVHELAVGRIRFVMTEYPPSGRGQGHVTHLYVFGSRSGLGADEARHFKLGLQIERKEYCHYTH